MASSPAPVQPYRYMAVFFAAMIGVYLLVFLTGDKQASPKLGIDLQGGTRVTLTARTPDGSKPTREALDQAQQIIAARVNGLGVSGSEVVIDGDNLVITVPGNDGSQARSLGQTARLYIRPVVGQPIPVEAVTKKPDGTPNAAPPGGAPPPAGAPGAPPAGAPAPAPATSAPPASPAPQPRPFPQEPTPSPTPPVPPAPGAPAPAAGPGGQPAPPGPPDPRKDLVARIKFEKELRQSSNQALLVVAVQYVAGRCGEEDFLAGNDDPNLPLVTCSQDKKYVYILDKSIISGDQIKDASASFNSQKAMWVVNLSFKDDAARTWADWTAANTGTATAFTLDSQVVSAPRIIEPIPGGLTEISGGDPGFTPESARELANVLKYGSLPLSFESSEAETVSATLGLASLKAGLIAGGIGLIAVLLYSLLYYRLLGTLTLISLAMSGITIYGILVLLGRYINYTLDLAGIAGLIIGIGTTADSFVVFFERIKDEIRDGRSFRSAVPRGWARGRTTILSGNTVVFLAAAVLYVLAVGQVKGFAFTLGLSALLDTAVVFLITWPLVYLASKTTLFAKPALNGLGAVQQIARERRAAGQAAEAATTGRG
ncbi:protein translocase subunit SecD [Mycolicibacterium sp.]|uniref:protein translocase subunit SecD n=1 Tax=Mycolicibacterium sp. TaxID=2320850 RepID=UPI0028B00DC8|nr:protein translocase subunit SecD [Mycolicibacterium sp.]